MEKICVAVRLRPPVSEDSSNGSFWKVEENRVSLHRIHGTPLSNTSYAFGTAFAYGQTSSGKTFTMNGSENDPGIIPRAVKDIFAKIETMSDREFLIRVSYMEIYNEEINDLLVVENQKLQIHESLERGVFVAGLREEIVNNAEQVLNLINSGEVNRHFGETNMNARSSRSHTIFRMVIESKGKEFNSYDDLSVNDIVRVSVLNLVDLAGSERIAKTGADGVRLKEGKYINKSLMVLGNVINKLSDGSKQRGHIPYRDSKLTRILQPALGGNAKTSIICTLAPEEIHIEETRGTLQFASRAKRITNCVQVNEILTDAALLKRQQLEIEELRKKLQYEMERGKLEMELEEERKSRNQWIRDQQQLKMENSSTRSFSDCNTNGSQGFLRHKFEECNDINSASHGDIFKSPCLKTNPSAFVAKRSKHCTLSDYSPLPDAFSNVADEDLWLKMNNGYVADLDSLQTTPTRKVQSFPSTDTTPVCTSQNEKYDREVQDLRRQLEIANEKINELKRKHSDEVPLSKRLMGETLVYRQETQLLQELPLRLSESVKNFKNSYEQVLSVMQQCASSGKLSTANMLSTMSEISAQLFSNLEASFEVTMDGERLCHGNYAPMHEQQRMFQEKVNNIITSLESSESSTTEEQERSPSCTCEHKDERDSLLQMFSESSQKLAMVSSQKENALKDLNTEVQRRNNLEGDLKQFTSAFACRQKSLISFHSEFKTQIEKLRAQTLSSV
ncbi:hypothetical protein Ahy_B06g085905 isoform B [Arachis hypogaea]|nr:hypothetical protein Ahy_B06g085905 isoform B [Arachis hypogaea]